MRNPARYLDDHMLRMGHSEPTDFEALFKTYMQDICKIPTNVCINIEDQREGPTLKIV